MSNSHEQLDSVHPSRRMGGRASLQAAGMTISEAFQRGMKIRESWLTSKNKRSIAQVYQQVAHFFGEHRSLASITREEVLDWRASMIHEPGRRAGSKLSPSTVNHRLSMLSVLMDVADVQAHRVRHLSTRGNHRTRRISDGELSLLGAWLASRDHLKGAGTLADLAKVALATAARQGELLGLNWVDVSGDSVTFRDTKNRGTRIVPVTTAARTILNDRRSVTGGPFQDIDAFRITVLWADFRAFLGLENDHEFVFHALRHEAISRLADHGVNAFTLQAIAGHSDVETTQRYVKTSFRAMAEAMGA